MMARLVSFAVLVTLVVVLAALSVTVLAGFILPIFLATILVVMFRPLHAWVCGKCAGHDRIAALLTTVAILMAVFAPLSLIVGRAVTEAYRAIDRLDRESLLGKVANVRRQFGYDWSFGEVRIYEDRVQDALHAIATAEATLPHEPGKLVAMLEKRVAQLRDHLENPGGAASNGPAAGTATTRDAPVTLTAELRAALDKLETDVTRLAAPGGKPAEQPVSVDEFQTDFERVKDQLFATQVVDLGLSKLRDLSTQLARSTISVVGRSIFGLIVLALSLYYFLADGPKMIEVVMRLSPLEHRYKEQMLVQFDTISRAVVVATLAAAVAQGILAGLGFFFAGLNSVFLLILMTMVFAMIPFVGAVLVWLPCCLWLYFYEEQTTKAIVLAIYCGVVVSQIDNVIKPWVLHGRSNLHPLLALLSILGGVSTLGPIGILVGPLAFALLHAALNMLQLEIGALGRRENDAERIAPQELPG